MATGSRTKTTDGAFFNIQAYIRVRPLASKEKRSHFEYKRREVTIKSSAESCKPSKTLLFNQVFQEDVKQITVYKFVVHPMINEVISGYNCTVFAYGQTGTGKTYTMCGEIMDPNVSWSENLHAGLIPRALDEIFSVLESQNCEYHVAVSYLELYNEKMRSLLGQTEEDVNIQLIDDPEGGVRLKGLLPTPVKSKEDAFRLLQEGTDKKHVAATLMNQNSSRSHTIFTITVSVKENISAGKDDVVRIGKLHLVDLAGSENVSKSGAADASNKTRGVNPRLAEASNINKSLLTLGRVITSIIDNNPHIPYRESKLTRFLRDSLGGRTMTCIIGTISPAISNTDESESTLNYTYKARSIKNKPEKNVTISKKGFMQVATDEILKLRRDLEAVRQGDGFYISNETHLEMTSRMQQLDAQLKEWNNRYSALQGDFDQKMDVFRALSGDYEDKCSEYTELENVYKAETKKLKENIEHLGSEIRMREYLITQYSNTEAKLTEEAKACRTVVEVLMENSSLLHDKIERKLLTEERNLEVLQNLKTTIASRLTQLKEDLQQVNDGEKAFLTIISENATNLCKQLMEYSQTLQAGVGGIANDIVMFVDSTLDHHRQLEAKMETESDNICDLVREGVMNERNALNCFVDSFIQPSLDQVKSRLRVIKQGVVDAFDAVFQKDEKEKSLRNDLENHVQSFTNVAKDITDEIAKNAESVRLALEQASTAKQSALIADKKANVMLQYFSKAMNLAREIKDLTNTSFESATRAEEALKDNLSRMACSENRTAVLVHTYGNKELDILDEIIKKRDESELVQSKFLDLLDARMTDLQRDFNTVLDRARTSVAVMNKQIDDHLEIELEHIKQNNETCLKHSNACTNNVKAFCGNLSKYVEDRLTDMKTLDINSENRLRKDHAVVIGQIDVLDKTMTQTDTTIANIQSELNAASYEEDIPLGRTPRRVHLEQLTYPKEFHSTAARNVLLDQYTKSEQNENQKPMSIRRRGKSHKTVDYFHGQDTLKRTTSMPDISSPSKNEENVPVMPQEKMLMISNPLQCKITPTTSKSVKNVLRERN